MAKKMITLADTFRTILRAWWRKRPALADEITSNSYFWYGLIDKGTGWYLDPERQAAQFALAELIDAIRSHSIRLYGRIDDNLPTDINETEVGSGILVFDNALEVYQPSTKSSPGRIVRAYRNVHCYAAEIDALIGTAANDPEPLPSRDTSEEACRKLIVSLDNSGLTKAVIFAKAQKAIPDLQLVEFKRAWFSGLNF
jgi:hypothetical protein